MYAVIMMIRRYINMIKFVFFVKQKPAYELRISDWSSDVCSSDLPQTLIVSHVSKLIRPAWISSYMMWLAIPSAAKNSPQLRDSASQPLSVSPSSAEDRKSVV